MPAYRYPSESRNVRFVRVADDPPRGIPWEPGSKHYGDFAALDRV